MKRISIILCVMAFFLIIPLTAYAEDEAGDEHEHLRALQNIVVSNGSIPYEGTFFCSECKSEYSDTITYEDLGMPVINISGSLEGISKTNKVIVDITYMSEEQSFVSSASLKVQGASSAGYPKKNFSVQFQKESGSKNKIKLVDSWGKQSKYCLKANYIDYSQSRNVVSARIYNEIVHSGNKSDELSALDNGGVIDGYPVTIFLNEEFLGLYTLNIPKENWLFGMNDETVKQAMLFGDTWADSVALRVPIADVNNVAGSGWDLEYCSTEDDDTIGTAWTAESMNELIQFINANDGDDFKNGIDNYTDIDRAIDVLIYTYFIHASDNVSKNIIWASYDGVKWIPSPYDMDGTWGLGWSGDFWYSPDDFPPAGGNVLFQRLLDNYSDEITARYVELRRSILSKSNIQNHFALFFGSIPQVLYAAEREKWTAVPSQDTNNYEQIIDYMKARIDYLDDYFGVTVTDNEETAYRVILNTPTGTKTYVYDTQDYTREPEESTFAFSKTADGTKTEADGQVNFLVVPPTGYAVSDVMAEPSDGYEKINGKEETGQEGIYRITNINSDLNVTIGLEKHMDHIAGENAEYLWTEDYSSCTARSACAVCGADMEETVSSVYEVKKANCNEEGLGVYSASFTIAGFEVQEKEVTFATGHNWEPFEDAPGLLKNGAAYEVCKVCGEKQNVQELPGWSTYYVKSLKAAKGKKSFTIKWKKQRKANRKKFNGYQIRYSTNPDMSDAKYTTAKNNSKSKKIEKLAKKTRYYIQVRTYTKKDGIIYYSKWSARKSVKTK